VSESVWRRIAVAGPDEGWPWTGGRTLAGYGHEVIGGRIVLVHRYVFRQTHGFLPTVVRHSCDNPPCCNPRPRLGGTQADNRRDRVGRGRQAAGERNGHAKLTDAQVEIVRARYAAGGVTLTTLAEEFGLASSSTMSTLIRGGSGPRRHERVRGERDYRQ